MPSKNPNVIKDADNPGPSHIKVLNKYEKRDRIPNQRPEGNYGVIRVPGNPDGNPTGGIDALIDRRGFDASTEQVLYSNEDQLEDLVSRMEDLVLTPQQMYFLVSTKKFVWFSAGIGSGKTLIGCWWTYIRILENPETLGLIGANTHDQLNQSTLKPFMEFLDEVSMPYVINKQPPKEWGIARLFKEYDNIMVFPNGCHILLRSLDKPTNLLGLTLGWFWIDETAYSNPKSYNVIVGRLRCKKSKCLMGRITSTPDGRNWLYKVFKSNPKFYKIIYQSARENPHLPEDFIPSLEATYDPLLAQQEIDGRHISTRFGRIYYQFREDIHVQDRHVYHEEKDLLMCWDFNSGEAPLCTELAQEFYNPITGVVEIQAFDEIAKEYSNTRQNTREFIERYRNHKGDILIYGDAFGDKNSSETDYEAILDELVQYFPKRKIKLHIDDSNPRQRDRVESVNAMLMNAKKQVRIFVSERCEYLKTDFLEVSPEDLNTLRIKKKNIKLTHASDAFGYMIHKRHPAIRIKYGAQPINRTVKVGGGY